MPVQTTVLTFNDLNTSIQVGDIVYYTTGVSNMGGFDNATLVNTVKLGPIDSMTNTTVSVTHDTAVVPVPPIN